LVNRDGLPKATTDGGAMAVLSLIEAAEQAATSKIDVWRAIQEGALPAQKTNDGGYAIDQADLFRVFERKQPEARLTPPDPSPVPDEAPVAKVDEASEPAAADEVSVAFAALQAELKSLLGSRGGASPVREDEPRDEPKERSDDEQTSRLTADLAAEKAEAARVVAKGAAPADERATPAETRRTWWRRLVG
jgi:hypothetical protein